MRLEAVEVMSDGNNCVSQRMENIVHARNEWKDDLRYRMEQEAERRAQDAEDLKAEEQDTIAAFADLMSGQEYAVTSHFFTHAWSRVRRETSCPSSLNTFGQEHTVAPSSLDHS